MSKLASSRRMEAQGACQLDIVLYSEVMASQDLIEVLYPINAVRNAALLMARTELVFQLDVDMLISQGLPAALADPARCGSAHLRFPHEPVYTSVTSLRMALTCVSKAASRTICSSKTISRCGVTRCPLYL